MTDKRHHSVTLSNLSRSDGSALLASNETVVQAAVYGPSEIKLSKELYDKAVVEVSFKRKVGQSDCTDRLLEYFIRNAIEPIILSRLHPRTSINIIIQEIQDTGNMLACCVNAACLALLDAGISMNGMCAAVSIGVFEDKVVPFPTEKEIKKAKCMSTICIKNPGDHIVGLRTSSFIEDKYFEKCVEVAKSSAEDILMFYKESIQRRFDKIS